MVRRAPSGPPSDMPGVSHEPGTVRTTRVPDFNRIDVPQAGYR
jgi:hypothetical protein